MIANAKATPKYLICDKDSIFWCEGFKRWCRRKRIRARYGAVGQHGSIAVVERFIRTMKNEGTRRVILSRRRTGVQRELRHSFNWYNEWRPHAALEGRTPNEVYLRLRPANRRPRIEPRKRWPRRSPCAGPNALVAGQPGDQITLEATFHGGQRHLPIVSLQRAAWAAEFTMDVPLLCGKRARGTARRRVILVVGGQRPVQRPVQATSRTSETSFAAALSSQIRAQRSLDDYSVAGSRARVRSLDGFLREVAQFLAGRR